MLDDLMAGLPKEIITMTCFKQNLHLLIELSPEYLYCHPYWAISNQSSDKSLSIVLTSALQPVPSERHFWKGGCLIGVEPNGILNFKISVHSLLKEPVFDFS